MGLELPGLATLPVRDGWYRASWAVGRPPYLVERHLPVITDDLSARRLLRTAVRCNLGQGLSLLGVGTDPYETIVTC